MPRRLTSASRWAAVGAVLLALVMLERAAHAASTRVTVLEAAVSLLAVSGAGGPGGGPPGGGAGGGWRYG